MSITSHKKPDIQKLPTKHLCILVPKRHGTLFAPSFYSDEENALFYCFLGQFTLYVYHGANLALLLKKLMPGMQLIMMIFGTSLVSNIITYLS